MMQRKQSPECMAGAHLLLDRVDKAQQANSSEPCSVIVNYKLQQWYMTLSLCIYICVVQCVMNYLYIYKMVYNAGMKAAADLLHPAGNAAFVVCLSL